MYFLVAQLYSPNSYELIEVIYILLFFLRIWRGKGTLQLQ